MATEYAIADDTYWTVDSTSQGSMVVSGRGDYGNSQMGYVQSGTMSIMRLPYNSPVKVWGDDEYRKNIWYTKHEH